jgi:hypothetical protein
MTVVAQRRRLLTALVVAIVLASCVVGYAVISSVPDHRTTLLVDTSAPGAEFSAIASAVSATAHNTGDDDALSLRRFGGACGAADNTSEVTDDATTIPGAVGGLVPSGRATLLSGLLAAVDDFSGVYPFRGSRRNRIVVVSATGVDACSQDQAEVSRTIRERVESAGLDLDIRIVGHRVPTDQRDVLKQLAGPEAVAFTENSDELTAVLDELVVPESPDAAQIDVTTSAPPPKPVYAFTSTTRLGVVRDGQVIAEVPAGFARGDSGSPLFTADGRFAFTVSAAGVVVVDTAAGTSRAVPCADCRTAVPVGGSRVAWLDQARKLVVLDLGVPDARPEQSPVVVPAPSAPGPYDPPPGLLAGADGAVLIAVADQPAAYGGPEQLYLADLGGSVTALGATTVNVTLTAGPNVISPDGRTVAYGWIMHGGACQERGAVTLLDVADGTVRVPLTNGVLGGSPNVDGAGVRDLWFDGDGRLNAIYSSWTCTASGGDATPVQPSTQWRLDGDQWVEVSADPVLGVRTVEAGVRAVITDVDERTRTGTLYTETAGGRTKVADQVYAIAVPS